MPETEGYTLVVKAIDMLTSEDYELTFIPRLNQLIDQLGKVRVLLYLDANFTGWEFGAAWDDAVFGLNHRHDFEKIAVAADQQWVAWATKVAAYFMDGQVVTYTLSEFKDAISWVKQ